MKRLYLESDRPVVVLYSAEGCAPCARLRPMLDAVIDEYEGERRGRGARGRGDERMDREGDHRSGSSAARSRASSSRRGRVHFVSVDVGLDPEVGEAAGIGGTPCVHVFVNREKRAHIEGVKMKTAYRSAIDACFVKEEGGRGGVGGGLSSRASLESTGVKQFPTETDDATNTAVSTCSSTAGGAALLTRTSTRRRC